MVELLLLLLPLAYPVDGGPLHFGEHFLPLAGLQHIEKEQSGALVVVVVARCCYFCAVAKWWCALCHHRK